MTKQIEHIELIENKRTRNQALKVAFIHRNYSAMTADQMAIQLGVTNTYIYRICRKIRVTPKKEYIMSNKVKDYTSIDEWLIENHGKYKAEVAAQKLGIKPYLVLHRRRALGLTKEVNREPLEENTSGLFVNDRCWVTGYKINSL